MNGGTAKRNLTAHLSVKRLQRGPWHRSRARELPDLLLAEQRYWKSTL